MIVDEEEIAERYQQAWLDGYEAGKAEVTIGWRFEPIEGVDTYGNVLTAHSDNVDEELAEIIGYTIAAQIVQIIEGDHT